MKCPKCEFENREGAKFCIECGHKFELICPECGTTNQVGSKYCGECGHDLRESIETPPIDYSEPHSYTPKHLKDKILTTRSSIEGERKLVTAFFADVANYTSISEKLDPEEVHQIMDGCFKILMDEIHKYEGTINQFTGDGVMALFGAPVAHEDHAQRACYAALSVQRAIREYGEELERDRGIEFQMRIGLNSGYVVVGSIGDDLRMDYTAVGDTTNLAARMESMTQPGCIIASRDTYRLVRDFFEFESLGKVEVKGKEEMQEVYELIKISEVETRIEAAAARGLTKFVGRKREVEALKEAFEKAQSGSGQVVGIVGEAGVGKSRLLLELRNKLPKAEYTYLEGRCLHYGGSMAYLPILDILRTYFDIKEGDREFIIKKKMEEKILQLDEELKGIFPPFQDILSLKVEDGAYLKVEPVEKKLRTFEAIRDLLIRESQNKPLVIAVEDLHWIDKTSEEFLDYLIGWLANVNILLILLYRPEYTHQWGSKSYYSKIGVDQLSTKTSAELVQAILEGGEVIGYTKEDIPSLNFESLLDQDDLPRTYEAVKELLEMGIQKEVNEFRLRRKDWKLVDIETVSSIIYRNGKPYAIQEIAIDITERKRAEKALREREAKLEIQTQNLQEANMALKVILKQRDQDRIELEEKVLFNLKQLVLPYLEKLKNSGLDERQKAYTEILESNLGDIISPSSRRLSSKYMSLTPAEIQVANLVKEGKTTKEIANLLNLSSKTIEDHRKGIREKIGIKNKKVNLRTHLIYIQ